MQPEPAELVLLPGLDGTGRFFAPLLEALPAWIEPKVIAYPPDPRLGYRELERLVAERLGARRVFLLGESFSGPLAVRLAAQRPAQVKGLILAATFLRAPRPSWLIRGAARLYGRFGAVPDAPVRYLLVGRTREKMLDRLRRDILATLPRGVAAARLREVAAADASRDVSHVTCPILLIHGSRDRLVPARGILHALEGRPGVTTARLDAAHMVLQTDADEVAGAIAQFIRSIQGRT